MTLSSLFAQHLSTLQQRFERILEKNSLAGLVIAAGAPGLYYADDRHTPFNPTPHFAYWCPAKGPHHVIVIRPSHKPRLFLFRENDYWHAPPEAPEAFWADHLDIVYCEDTRQCWQEVERWKNFAYMGPESELPSKHGLTLNPPQLIAHADWARAQKTPYEIHCLREANKKAARAHQAVRTAFASGDVSEFGLYHVFMQSLSCVDEELPYTAIIGLDKNSSILHYQYKQTTPGGSVLLIDAGARYYQYGSDITRTYAKKSAPATFRSLLQGVDTLQQQITAQVKTGVSFAHLHEQTHILLAELLLQHGVLHHCTVDEAIDRRLTFAFLPHGLGHVLGIQVHDVSGKQADEDGNPCTIAPRFPNLRTLRNLQENDVITIEPGLYFIPMLIEKMSAGEHARFFNMPLIKELLPYGGIRIEDDVVVHKNGAENLTRQFLSSDFLV